MPRFVVPAAVLSLIAARSAADCVWGSFDGTRVNYTAGVLRTGADHETLRGIIASEGGTIGADTALLTPAYLADKDVFYTSLLDRFGPPLAAREQAALQGWFNAGGTLIVTADIYGVQTYESFTSFLGVSNFAVHNQQVGNFPATPTAAHALVAGVSMAQFTSSVSFDLPGSALTLMRDDVQSPFMAVMEASTGFPGGGRLLVLADHNLFTDQLIGLGDNHQLAENMAHWACVPEPGVLGLAAALAGLGRKRRA